MLRLTIRCHQKQKPHRQIFAHLVGKQICEDQQDSSRLEAAYKLYVEQRKIQAAAVDARYRGDKKAASKCPFYPDVIPFHEFKKSRNLAQRYTFDRSTEKYMRRRFLSDQSLQNRIMEHPTQARLIAWILFFDALYLRHPRRPKIIPSQHRLAVLWKFVQQKLKASPDMTFLEAAVAVLRTLNLKKVDELGRKLNQQQLNRWLARRSSTNAMKLIGRKKSVKPVTFADPPGTVRIPG